MEAKGIRYRFNESSGLPRKYRKIQQASRTAHSKLNTIYKRLSHRRSPAISRGPTGVRRPVSFAPAARRDFDKKQLKPRARAHPLSPGAAAIRNLLFEERARMCTGEREREEYVQRAGPLYEEASDVSESERRLNERQISFGEAAPSRRTVLPYPSCSRPAGKNADRGP